MCWQNDVQLTLAEDEDPRNFMIVTSGSYVLAIPDLSHYARHEADPEVGSRPESASSVSSRKQLAVFKKTVMKLNGNVRWVVGLVFERNLDGGGRSFEFIPHYNVSLKNPKYAKPSDGKVFIAHVLSLMLLTPSRTTMRSEASAVITYICLLLSLLLMIESGLLLTWSHPRLTTAFILLPASLHTFLTGGPCSPARCPCLYDRVNFGLESRNPVRSLGDISQPSSTIFCSHHYT